MQRIFGKKSAVEGARHGGNEAAVGSDALVLAEVGAELGQRHEHVVEVVAWEIVQQHPQLRHGEADLATRFADIVDYLRDGHQSVGARGAPEIGYPHALRETVLDRSEHRLLHHCLAV